LRPLRALLNLVLHLQPLGQPLEALTADRAEVDEDVSAPVVLRDEAVALVVAESLHGSGCHLYTSLDRITNVQRKAQTKTDTRSYSLDPHDSTRRISLGHPPRLRRGVALPTEDDVASD
jgi:hypothetical protein